MRSILLHAHRDPGFESRFQAALDVTRQVDGHLTCLQAIIWDIALPGDIYATMAAELVPVVMEEAASFRAEVEARLEKEDVRWDWVDEPGMADIRLMEYAALADLVVLGAEAPREGRPGPSPLVGTMAIHGRAPLLVMPKQSRRFSVEAPAVVAWNGSPESCRALRTAVPLLARSKKVWLVQVAAAEQQDGSDQPSLSGAEYLSRHGIDCELIDLPMRPEGVAATLEHEALARDAGYIVMGAYGHSRMMEILFGGVTRKSLANPALPLLIAH